MLVDDYFMYFSIKQIVALNAAVNDIGLCCPRLCFFKHVKLP